MNPNKTLLVTSNTGQTTTCCESGASPKKKLKIRFSVLFGSPLETTKAPCLHKLSSSRWSCNAERYSTAGIWDTLPSTEKQESKASKLLGGIQERQKTLRAEPFHLPHLCMLSVPPSLVGPNMFLIEITHFQPSPCPVKANHIAGQPVTPSTNNVWAAAMLAFFPQV